MSYELVAAAGANRLPGLPGMHEPVPAARFAAAVREP